jgi:hypothetical protein
MGSFALSHADTTTSSGEQPAGSDTSAAAPLANSKAPLDALGGYLDAFHIHNGNMKAQVEAHHYCGEVGSVTQCVIYDSNTKDARLMGIEYIVGENVYKTLPEEEKKLWHSHVYEVKSGQLIMPDMKADEEHEHMKGLISTYGKTWHTWNMHGTDSQLPLGIPELMMAFTEDGQADTALVDERDKRFGISTEEKRKQRADIPAPEIQAGADSWKTGEIITLKRTVLSKDGK